MSSTYKELKEQATALGLEFSGNITKDALIELISSDEPNSIEKEEFEDGPAEAVPEKAVKPVKKLTPGQRAARAKKRATTLRIVTITDNDPRENSDSSTVPPNCTNEFFDLPTKRIPLNVPVEIAQGYINVLKEIEIPHHTRSSTGNSVSVMRKRYSIANS